MRRAYFSAAIIREEDGNFATTIRTATGVDEYTCDTKNRAQDIITRALGEVVYQLRSGDTLSVETTTDAVTGDEE